MYDSAKGVVLMVSLVAVLGGGAGGCANGGHEQDSAVEEAKGATEDDVDEARSAYVASPKCTEEGGGTWGAILKMCVTVSDDGNAEFTITKINGTNFQTAGTMHLKVGTADAIGVDHASRTLNGGSIVSAITFQENFGQWPNYPKKYYARWESDAPGVAWVGPITVHI